MRNLNELNEFRDYSKKVLQLYGSYGDHTCGSFLVKSKIDKANMRIIASSGEGWEHVSISRKNRCPNWIELQQVKEMFFHDTETVVQYHVPPEDHVNNHPNCLHLWRPTEQEIPRPPVYMVGLQPEQRV